MPLTSSQYILLSLIAACTNTLPWDGPNPTKVGAEIARIGWSPKATQAAMLKDALFGNFGKRQMGYHVCGYNAFDQLRALSRLTTCKDGIFGNHIP